MDLERLIGTGWPIIAALGTAVVWLVRLEGKVNLLSSQQSAQASDVTTWRAGHQREVDALVGRNNDHVQRIERDLERLDASLDNVRERLRAAERALNGKLTQQDHPWDQTQPDRRQRR